MVNTRGLFGLAMAVLGIWMLLVAQWVVAATERTVCYMWWTTIGIGSFALVLGTLTAVWNFRRS